MNTADVLGVALLVTGRPVAGAAVLAANLVYKLTAWPYVVDRRFARARVWVSQVTFLAPPSRRRSLRIRKARSVMRAYEARQAAWKAKWSDDGWPTAPSPAAVHLEPEARLYTEAALEHIVRVRVERAKADSIAATLVEPIEPDCGV